MFISVILFLLHRCYFGEDNLLLSLCASEPHEETPRDDRTAHDSDILNIELDTIIR